MNYLEENIKQVRKIIDDLYSCIVKVGVYSELAEEIESACRKLNDAVDKYEEEVKENL